MSLALPIQVGTINDANNDERHASYIPMLQSSGSAISLYEARRCGRQLPTFIILCGGLCCLVLYFRVEVYLGLRRPLSSYKDNLVTRHPMPGDSSIASTHFVLPTGSQRLMSLQCADQWISKGVLCAELLTDLNKPVQADLEAPIDVVWTFVQNTPYFQAWKDEFARKTQLSNPSQGGRARNFRDLGQLKYSMRSVSQNMPFARTGSVLSTSLPCSLPNEATAPSEAVDPNRPCYKMQVPPWYNLTSEGPSSKIRFIAHWDVFSSSLKDRITTLPTFNSHAIESQLINVPGLSDTLVYLNDDMYIAKAVAQSDFASALYGPVYRLDYRKWFEGTDNPEELLRLKSQARGRVSAYTASLVDARFGKRFRNWFEHVPYTIDVPMLKEVSEVWQSEVAETSAVRFRGTGNEIYAPLLSAFWNIEKHREALLWSFIMLKSDSDLSNSWSIGEKHTMLQSLGGQRAGDRLGFRTPNRLAALDTEANESIEPVFRRAGLHPPTTWYRHTSADGYPYSDSRNTSFGAFDGRYPVSCSVSLTRCFGSNFFGAETSDVPEATFKRIAFQRPKCGDCIIVALLGASGEVGLEAFLPPKRGAISTEDNMALQAFIGGTSLTWQDADFTPSSTLRDERLRRAYAVRLIQRYSYVMGKSETYFGAMHGNPDTTTAMLRDATGKTLIGINDALDVEISAQELKQHQQRLLAWEEALWPVPAHHEKLS